VCVCVCWEGMIAGWTVHRAACDPAAEPKSPLVPCCLAPTRSPYDRVKLLPRLLASKNTTNRTLDRDCSALFRSSQQPQDCRPTKPHPPDRARFNPTHPRSVPAMPPTLPPASGSLPLPGPTHPTVPDPPPMRPCPRTAPAAPARADGAPGSAAPAGVVWGVGACGWATSNELSNSATPASIQAYSVCQASCPLLGRLQQALPISQQEAAGKGRKKEDLGSPCLQHDGQLLRRLLVGAAVLQPQLKRGELLAAGREGVAAGWLR
jgi:hypothetical protein